MTPPLPSSLSPHICVLPSQDLTDLLSRSSLPSLPSILQSFSPLPQVTTRTTSLVPVPHTSFTLRFSDLTEIEEACREDEDQRAVRTLDWIGARINKRCAKWAEDLSRFSDKNAYRTPWWDELKRCTEGDHVPTRSEGWNHPVAIILAISTTASNPLQAITTLHSHPLDLPSWVDPNILRYTLIIHPANSPLSDDEAGALFNVVKKQYGLHSYLLTLSLPAPLPPPVPVPALFPRLPAPPSSEFSNHQQAPVSPTLSDAQGFQTLRMAEKDIQQTARFAREFLVMSLLPWMEKNVMDWNEMFSSTRRLPSRLFSSTRRLFGSPSPSPAPQALSFSVTSLPTRVALNSLNSTPAPPSQRRLAEFATILGDLKLAIAVWEALRKEGKGGLDILPLLLSPSPTSSLYAFNALSALHLQLPDPRPLEQMTALKYAIRWETGITTSDFLNYPLEGERWLVWAAGNSEEPPAALLLAHAALLSSKKLAQRRAALWYLSAANRLEKCGVKPLTMFFLRRAHELYSDRPRKSLSPSFWESEGESRQDLHGIDAILSGIEHPLGRLLYTTGDVAEAVRFFLGLLRDSNGYSTSLSAFPRPILPVGDGAKLPGTDRVFLDDFRVAYAHFKAISPDSRELKDLKLPFKFCLERQTRLRMQETVEGKESGVWEARELQWKSSCKSLGGNAELLPAGKAPVNETFWLDLVLQNPLDAEINLSNLTIRMQETSVQEETSSSLAFVDVGIVDDVVLEAGESRTVPIYIKSNRPASLIITHATYNFLSLLPSAESLTSRGQRLHDTAAQRQQPTYAPDLNIRVDIEEVNHKLLVSWADDDHLILAQGENKSLKLWISNIGHRPIKEVWMVVGPEDGIWYGPEESQQTSIFETSEVIVSQNSLTSGQPQRIVLREPGTLNPGGNLELPIQLHIQERTGEQELHLLFVYRENESDPFRSARVGRYYEVHKLLGTSVLARPSQSLDHSFLLQLELDAVHDFADVQLTQITSLSPTWKCSPISKNVFHALQLSQSSRLLFGVSSWDEGSGSQETLTFVSTKLQDVLIGRPVKFSDPPPIDLLCCHLSTNPTLSIIQPRTAYTLDRSRRAIVVRTLSQLYPHIATQSHPYIFPLYNPASIDFVVFWKIPSQGRSGQITVPGLVVGVGHAALSGIIEEVEKVKVKRSIYVETQREKVELLGAIRGSEWNYEVNPTVILLQPETLHHNFTLGPCHTAVTVIIRNYSLSHKVRFLLRFTAEVALPPTSNLLPPPYTGRLAFRSTLEPSATAKIKPSLWITRPGTYCLGGWSLETEVLEISRSQFGRNEQVLHRYKQESSLGDMASLLVCAIQSV